MSSKRPVVLTAILLMVMAVGFGLPALERQMELAEARRAEEPLPGTNSVTDFTVERTPEGRWFARGTYFYTGEPKPAWIGAMHSTGPLGGKMEDLRTGRSFAALRGSHPFSIELHTSHPIVSYVTQRVWITLSHGGKPLATASRELTIQWPDWATAQVDAALAAGQPQQAVDQAVKNIDTGNPHALQQARALLQKLVEKSPRTASAYVELARLAMETSVNADALANAEALTKTALEIEPESANARIVLGHVYAHQGRHKQAESLLAEAAASNPPNLWLWAHWGEVLTMQNQIEPAIAKYREAVARPPTGNTYDRAREDAYGKLLPLLALRKDLDGMEALHRQRAQDYADRGCYRPEYALFLVLRRAAPDAALAQLGDASRLECESAARQVRGLAHYVQWAQGQDPGRAERLHQARAFMPVTPRLLRTLASSERTVDVVRQLAGTGLKVGMQDAQQLDALAHAMRDGDMDAARHLLKLGAQPAALVGPEQMPVALLPVIMRNFDGIRLMQRAGVDYRRLRFQGMTALDHAKAQGDRKLLQQLDPKEGSL